MAFSTQYAQQYQQAVSAYMQGHYEEAVSLTTVLVTEYPDDPNLQLLCGHIYSCLKQYDVAQRHYQKVVQVSHDPELLSCAQNSLSDVAQILGDKSIEDMTEPAAYWPKASSYSVPDGEVTQIQTGLTSSRTKTNTPATNPNLAMHNKTETTLDSEPQAGWRSLLFQEQSFEDSTSNYTDLDPASELFDDDEEITLLMGKKGSQKPEASMSDDQFSGEHANLSTASPTNNAIEENLKAVGGSEPAQAQESLSSRTQDYGEDFSAFLDHIDNDDMGASENDFDMVDSLEDATAFHINESLGASFSSGSETPSKEWEGEGVKIGAISDLAPQFLGNESPQTSSTNVVSDVFPNPDADNVAALNVVSRRSPILAPFENVPLNKKPVIMAASTGVMAGAAALTFGSLMPGSPMAKIGLGALAAGAMSGLTTLALSRTVTRQLKASTSDLHAKLSAVAQGDWGVKAIEFSNDEFGQLAKSFNKMTHFIESSTKDSQRKADDQEKAKEDLQRQVIRLLDDVEGAARGDLTVQAEVTADILGAVADSFNLTIYNLQKIVKQVKVAAGEVNKGAAENEEFARELSSDALRQAEELAATLNSVQMMTTSIQEVADSARSADQVAQRASEAALKGGESVESTVAGIMQIRETVAETTRKVKRLAESSQEISKIVGLISQIASRTNLLALNASIEAARAGESGRGFAVVADEVRQLADRAAKSSKEIEQIVLQIQGETSSVMAAMEEGTQQVIEGTQRAEQAKHSLEDIIQVSEQIKQLVGSITKATSEQTETSRYVGQVMQSVELTAQETSQEAQRVSDSLRNLVGVARDLQSSVERFKVEGTEFS
jgi:twitching motility protein PilJ